MSKQKFIYPISKFILVKSVEAPAEENLGGLVMPVSADDSVIKRVEVVQISKDLDLSNSIKVGSIIIVPSVTRNEIKFNGEKHYLVHIEEVFGYESETKYKL